jgi:3D (Asp-Asp-Asp) domain-containing protein
VKNTIYLSVVILYTFTASFIATATERDPLALDTFNFPEPRESDLGKKINLWATYYNLPQLQDETGAYPLRDKESAELGPHISHRGWCDAAMEGSVRIKYKNGDAKTFNYAAQTSDSPVNCKEYFKIDVSKTKFREAAGPYGDGLDEYILEPYRTIASDNAYIVPGTILYIPKAKGAMITLESGRTIQHDGYFFVGDKGGAIKKNHVDVFIGTHTSAPFFPWVGSNQSKTFDAYIVQDQQIISELKRLHAR